MLNVMDKSTHEEHLSQPPQTKYKQFEIAITFSTGYDGIFSVTNSVKKVFPQNQFLIKMVLNRLLYHRVLTKSKV